MSFFHEDDHIYEDAFEALYVKMGENPTHEMIIAYIKSFSVDSETSSEDA